MIYDSIIIIQIGSEREPPIQEEDENKSEEDRPHQPPPPHITISMETPQECATRLRRIAQSGEYREQYQALLAVKPRSGHAVAR